MLTLGEKAEMALRVVREEPKIAFDVETSGLDWRVHNPVGYVITADAERNFYIPIRHGGGANLMDGRCRPLETATDRIVIHEWEEALADAFEERIRRGFLTIGHHLKFDMHMSANAGILLGRNCGDTQHNAAMLNEYARSFSLANVAKSEGVTPKLGESLYRRIKEVTGCAPSDHKAMEFYWQLPGDDEEAVAYSCGDGITTLEVWDSQMKAIEEEGMSQIQHIESQLIWTVFRMERRGIKVDEKYTGALVEAIHSEQAAAKLVLPEGFNPRSGPQTRALFEQAGITNWPTTAIGNPSFTEGFLKKSELGRSIIAIRQLENLENTFVGPLVEQHIFEGRVHATLNQLKADDHGTVSGRFSCSDPNLQAIHKRNKVLGRRFRKIFVADPGMDFNEADYSQCEPRLFAHYSKEPSLLEGYNQTPFRDMHAVVAEMMKVDRDVTAKRMNMGILTGMQVNTFAGHMGWTVEEAAAKHREWFEVFPGIKQFQDKAKRAFRDRGYVVTILGRKCHLDNPRFAYRGTSRIIQGGNGDILKERMLRCDEYLESEGDITHLLMTVHDSLNWQSPKGAEGERHSREMVAIATDVQGAPFNLRVPFVMDVGKGDNWAEATYGPE